jgi:ankyrin repeat protein
MLLKAKANVNFQAEVTKFTMLHNAIAKYDTLGRHIPLLLAHGALTDVREANGNTPLHMAIMQNHRSAVKLLLESDADVNAVNNDLMTPLGIALTRGNAGTVSALLLHGADVHVICNGSHCALFHALHVGKSGMVSTLLNDYSADEDIHRVDNKGNSVLHWLAVGKRKYASDIADQIIGYGTDINAVNEFGDTPLHTAASWDNTNMIKKLLEHGATIDIQNQRGETPLALAKRLYKGREVIECLNGTVRKSWWRMQRKELFSATDPALYL